MIVFYSIFFLSLISFLTGYSQNSSRNGYHHAPYGTIRALVVFAEVVNDPHERGANAGWNAGQMPPNAGNFFDPSLPVDGKMNGFLTQYFHEASFGRFLFLGDFYPELVRINFDTLRGKGEHQVIDFLNSREGEDLITSSGLSINSGDFDQWTIQQGRGSQNIERPDGRIDMLFILWRVNSRINARSGGYISTSPWNIPLKASIGFNDYASMVGDWHVMSLVRHEFVHSLLGGNSFHSGGAGAGAGMFLSNIGGHSLISSWNRNFDFVNGWDRRHLGWKNPENQFFISARDVRNNEVNADLEYGDNLPTEDGVFVLRDFASSGDAVRIKLPYLLSDNPNAREQWIWIENHQFPEGMLHYKDCMARGIYINVQVGNDQLTTNMNSRTNYIYPLPAFGNYDWEYMVPGEEGIADKGKGDEKENPDSKRDPTHYTISTTNERSNPFTGFHTLMLHATNYIEAEKDQIFNMEYITPSGVIFNGEFLPESDFCYRTFPAFGNRYDAFLPGMKLGISENPAPVPLLTYHTRDRMGNYPPYPAPASDDNRKVYLNGLSVHIVEQKPQGEVVIRIQWDDYDVNKNLRWCGPLVLHEKINIKPGNTITLDQGLSPVRPVDPIIFNDSKIFADHTLLSCREGSLITLEQNSRLEIMNNSTLSLEPGASLEVQKGSIVRVHPGSHLIVKNGARVKVSQNGRLEIMEGASICVEEGAAINLMDRKSQIVMSRSYMEDDHEAPDSIGLCIQDPSQMVITGKGTIRRFR